MRTFVIRLHERHLDDHSLHGVVEDIATGLRLPFSSADELTELLSAPITDNLPQRLPGS